MEVMIGACATVEGMMGMRDKGFKSSRVVTRDPCRVKNF
jgi:hypothetical protein